MLIEDEINVIDDPIDNIKSNDSHFTKIKNIRNDDDLKFYFFLQFFVLPF